MGPTRLSVESAFRRGCSVAPALALTLVATLNPAPVVAEARDVIELVAQVGGEMRGIVVADGYAYVAQAAQVLIFNLDDPATPQLVSVSDMLPATIKDLTIIGNVVVTALGHAGVAVVDAHDPRQPRIVGRLHTPTTYHLEAVGGYVLAFAGEAILTVDVSDAAQPRVAATHEPFVAVSDGRFTLLDQQTLFVASSSNVIVLDAADPLHLSVARWLEATEVWGIAATSTAVFVTMQVREPATGECRMDLHVLDRSRDSMLETIGLLTLPECDPMAAIVTHGDDLILRYRSGLQLVDVSEPGRPRIGKYIDTPLDGVISEMYRPKQAAVLGDWLLLTTNATAEAGPEPQPGGIVVVDLGGSEVPAVRLGWFDDGPAVVTQAARAGGLLVLSGGLGDAIRIYDTSAGSRPTLLSTITPESPPNDIAAEWPWLVTAEILGLRVIDLTEPAEPITRATWDSLNNVSEVAVVGSVVYAGVANSSESGPEWREIVAFQLAADGGLTLHMRVDVCRSPITELMPVQETMYVLCRDEGLVLVDISDRYRPVVKASAKSGYWANALAVADGIAFIATREATPPDERDLIPTPKYGGLHALDTNDRRAIRPMGVVTTQLLVGGVTPHRWGLVASRDEVIMAAGERAVRVVDVGDPSQPEMVQVVPLPSGVSALVRIDRYVYAAGEEGGLYVFRFVKDVPASVGARLFLPLAVVAR